MRLQAGNTTPTGFQDNHVVKLTTGWLLSENLQDKFARPSADDRMQVRDAAIGTNLAWYLERLSDSSGVAADSRQLFQKQADKGKTNANRR
jgi:hypothetical protein